MKYQIVIFMVLFVATAILHKPLNAHDTDKKCLKITHYWFEHAVVIQGIIVVNELIKVL
jgi:hypothetical protein